MKGKIYQWKDDKGFGFIQPDDGSEKVFFHISSVKTKARRPQIGDNVLYDAIRDSQHRLKAKGVVIEGLISTQTKSTQRPIRTEGPKHGIIDYISILVIIISVVTAGLSFFRSNDLSDSWPFGIPAVIAFFVLSRQKKPKEKSFTCARCGTVAEYDTRTIKAWNNGFKKLYCRTCHLKWLRDNPPQKNNSTRAQGRGCLGVLSLLILIPIFSGVTLYQLLT